MNETRIIVFNRSGGFCEVCGKPIDYAYQMAHRIPQRKHFVKKYGKAVIHHPLNFRATCGLRCNNAVSIGNHPLEIERIVEEIKNARIE